MAEPVRAFAPGRVNLIGEHTDYNGGLALPFAIAAGITVTARPITAPVVRARALDLDAGTEIPLRVPPRARGWRAFVHGAVAELQAEGFSLRGTELAISGDLPRGSGLSSSAALAVALCLALVALAGGRIEDRLDLARLCSRIENRWAGARTGLLDQIACLCGAAGHGVLIDFRPLSVTRLALPLAGHRLVVLDSGQRRANAGPGYAARRRDCEAACAQLGVASLREAGAAQAEGLPEPLRRRARHVIGENGRVLAAVAALEGGDLVTLGRLLDASHASLRDDFEVSTPAVEAAVERLRDAGALGARLIGGGFGGHVLGLLPPGAEAPEGAVEVSPSDGARLL